MATIKGKWKWKASIDDNIVGDFYESVNFKSNGEEFSKLNLAWSTGVNTISYVDSSNRYVWFRNCGEPGTAVTDEKYRTMDFGETEQEIGDGLYAFIIANAIEIASLTIAEKLVAIAENQQRVYDAGKLKGISISGAGGAFDEGKAAGIVVGQQNEYDRFWDAYQSNGVYKSYAHAFAGNGWNDATFKPKYDLKVTYGYMMFRDCAVSGDLDEVLARSNVSLDFTQMYDAPYLFSQCAFSRLGVIDLSNMSTINNTFTNSKKLETIEELILKDNCSINNPFSQCTALKNIKITGIIGDNLTLQTCTLLTKASIESIINHLSGSTSNKILTLSKTAVDKAFEAVVWDEEASSTTWLEGSNTEEWTALRQSKSNWTITLV
jgi:hypothetical protein